MAYKPMPLRIPPNYIEPHIHYSKGKAMHNILLPTTMYSRDINSPDAFIKILASIKHLTPMELHKKLANRNCEVETYFRWKIRPECDLKNLLEKKLAFSQLSRKCYQRRILRRNLEYQWTKRLEKGKNTNKWKLQIKSRDMYSQYV